MNPFLVMALVCAIAIPVHIALWMVQRRTGNAGVIDLAWTIEVGAGAVAICLLGDGDPIVRYLAAAMAGLWGLKLTVYLIRRLSSDAEEDARYRLLRKRWGERTDRLMLGFFLLQVVFVAIFLLPFPFIAQAGAVPLAVLIIAAGCWLVGLGGTAVADAQLAAWRRKPEHHGLTCRQGLWAWSRHPNYFFEWITWWAYPLLALSAPAGFVALLFPILLLYLLIKVTGIPYTELAAVERRGEDYRKYQREVSPFFPLPPRINREAPS
jgi:steroid 5-alpha reductase family enzyme